MTDEGKKDGVKVTDKRKFTIDEDGNVNPRTDVAEEAAEKDEKKTTTVAEEESPQSDEDDLGPCGDDEEPCDECDDQYQQLPPIDFISFIFSLSTATMAYLGILPDPATQKINKNLSLAKQHIDLLGMLQEKTEGNLSDEESKFLSNSLYDLRMKFVEVCKN